MTAFEKFFDGNIFVINLARRPDRLKHFAEEMKKCGIEYWERFEAIDAGPDMGNHGCTASHRAVMDMIVRRGLRRAFVFEDDATLRDQFVTSFHEELEPVLRETPDDYDMIYLGGHYGEMPRGWFSKHLILMGAMKTTSSYGVTLKSARELRDLIPVGTGDSIDNLYSYYNATKLCLISEPRFFVQYNNYSDLQKRQMNNTPPMEDTSHVTRLGNIGKHGQRPRAADVPPPAPVPPAPVIAPASVVPPPPEPVVKPIVVEKFIPSWSGRKRK